MAVSVNEIISSGDGWDILFSTDIVRYTDVYGHEYRQSLIEFLEKYLSFFFEYEFIPYKCVLRWEESRSRYESLHIFNIGGSESEIILLSSRNKKKIERAHFMRLVHAASRYLFTRGKFEIPNALLVDDRAIILRRRKKYITSSKPLNEHDKISDSFMNLINLVKELPTEEWTGRQMADAINISAKQYYRWNTQYWYVHKKDIWDPVTQYGYDCYSLFCEIRKKML